MKIKRFHATDVRQALKEVRDTLGADAVILSNNRVDGGVEIVAATDYDESKFNRNPQVEPTTAPNDIPPVEINPTQNITPPPVQAAQNIWSQEPTLIQMRKEMAGLKSMLENQMSDLAWKDMKHANPTQLQLLQRCLKMGIHVDVAKQITANARDTDDLETAWLRCLASLASQIETQDNDIISIGGIYALVGPTGVGKTTTIAKIAARCALKHGAKNVALITTDCYRIGGQEQLRTYAKILGVPVRVAKTHQELGNALNELLDRRFILIDTAGMSQRDMKITEKFSLLQHQSPMIRNYLTLSATTQSSVLSDIINAFSHLLNTGCI
jgi:flagellar biosynthesis protein FlhF